MILNLINIIQYSLTVFHLPPYMVGGVTPLPPYMVGGGVVGGGVVGGGVVGGGVTGGVCD